MPCLAVHVHEKKRREGRKERRRERRYEMGKIRVLPVDRRRIRSLSETGLDSSSLLVFSLNPMPSLSILDGVAMVGVDQDD